VATWIGNRRLEDVLELLTAAQRREVEERPERLRPLLEELEAAALARRVRPRPAAWRAPE
jgi:hypothetical protein